MALVSLNCPNCGGSLKMEDTMEKGFCMYCGSSFLVKDEIQRVQVEHSGNVNLNLNREKEVENLLIRAEQKINEYEMSNEDAVNGFVKIVGTYESIMKDYIEKALDIEPNFPKTLELKQRLISIKAQKVNKAIEAANKTKLGCFIIALVIFLLFLYACSQI